MTPAGVFLHLDSAMVNTPSGAVGLSDMTLGLPLVTFPFDCQSGPRGLRSHLSTLDSVTVDVPFPFISKACSGMAGGDYPPVVEAGADGIITLSGAARGIPFSVRIRFEKGEGRLVRIVPVHPRIFGLCEIAWADIGAAAAAAIVAAWDGTAAQVDILRPAIKPLMAGLGFKLPLMDETRLSSVAVDRDRIRFVFSSSGEEPAEVLYDGDSSFATPADGGEALSSMLASLSSAPSDHAAVAAFIERAIASPVMWPEVLARALVLANERPEMVSPLLAVVLIGAENPGWLGVHEFLQTCRRLLAAAAVAGSRAEASRCAAVAAGVVDRFDPASALDLLNEIRAAGFETREVLEAVAVTFNRLDRHFDASTTRLRALAMVLPGREGDAVRGMVDRMEAAGLGAQAAEWLDDLASLAAAGRFGQGSGAVLRASLLLSATREAVSSGERAREGLRRILKDDPCDVEALETMMALAVERHEVAEAVELFRIAAERSDGRARCELMLAAGKAVHERFGLRRRAAELLEAGLEADPSCREAAELLDVIYAALGRSAQRVALASRRLQGCVDPAARGAILVSMVRAAVDAGMTDSAAAGVKELLRSDPANLEYLKLGEAVFARSGDEEALRQVCDALADVCAGGADAGLEEALASGNPAAAVARIRAVLAAERIPARRVELLLQAADLCMIDGDAAAARPFLAEAADADPVPAMESACRACTSAAPDPSGLTIALVRDAARAAMSRGAGREAAEIILAASERVADKSMATARGLLETALPLDPDNVSIRMALAAAYEALGMKGEAEALLGGG